MMGGSAWDSGAGVERDTSEKGEYSAHQLLVAGMWNVRGNLHQDKMHTSYSWCQVTSV